MRPWQCGVVLRDCGLRVGGPAKCMRASRGGPHRAATTRAGGCWRDRRGALRPGGLASAPTVTPGVAPSVTPGVTPGVTPTVAPGVTPTVALKLDHRGGGPRGDLARRRQRTPLPRLVRLGGWGSASGWGSGEVGNALIVVGEPRRHPLGSGTRGGSAVCLVGWSGVHLHRHCSTL